MNLLSRLTRREQTRLLEELNYMNLAEIHGFCGAHGIPYRIVAEDPAKKLRATVDTDRKPIVLARLLRYLRTGNAGQPTRIPAKIVRTGKPPARLGPRDRIFYRWYAKEHTGVIRELGHLTGGQFKDGAVARVLAMNFWTRGTAPTLQEFARAWLKARERMVVTPEYAYLTDLQRHGADGDWKTLRRKKAASALKTLERIAPVR